MGWARRALQERGAGNMVGNRKDCYIIGLLDHMIISDFVIFKLYATLSHAKSSFLK